MEPAPPATCPRCRNVPLDDQPLVRHCGRCRGSWISEQALHERVEAARGPRPRLTWRREARAALRCALCADPMETLVVHDTPVDRCPPHGIWFDTDELAHVLASVAAVAPVAAAAAATDPVQQSIVSDVAEGGVEVALEAADVASVAGDVAEAGGGVFEVVVDGVGFVAEAVVDLIAGIFS